MAITFNLLHLKSMLNLPFTGRFTVLIFERKGILKLDQEAEAYKKQLGFLFAKFKKEGTLNANKNKNADGYIHKKKQNARPFLLPARKKIESEGYAIIEKFFITELNKLYK